MFERLYREFRDQPGQGGENWEARKGRRGGARFFGPFSPRSKKGLGCRAETRRGRWQVTEWPVK